MKKDFIVYYYHSPIGCIEICATNDSILQLKFVESENAISTTSLSIIIENCIIQLKEYFENKRLSFDLPLALKGSEFQQKVWETIREIPFGKTRTYKEIAIKIGKPSAVRAVANAIAKNPILIIIPCHRIIGSNRSLTGYSGGIERKRSLLKHEKTLI